MDGEESRQEDLINICLFKVFWQSCISVGRVLVGVWCKFLGASRCSQDLQNSLSFLISFPMFVDDNFTSHLSSLQIVVLLLATRLRLGESGLIWTLQKYFPSLISKSFRFKAWVPFMLPSTPGMYVDNRCQGVLCPQGQLSQALSSRSQGTEATEKPQQRAVRAVVRYTGDTVGSPMRHEKYSPGTEGLFPWRHSDKEW